ncbi:LAFA_0B00342g1_1 [Lachancea sp. 'fantastica']|nr:LAFA_0B00342g1_1 [Lachancea sp. 'fantastica']
MSIEDDLNTIIGENPPARKTTKYRRRDLRNGLASRLGQGSGESREDVRRDLDPDSYAKSARLYNDEDVRGSLPKPKKRLRIMQIPLDVSDFTVEDLVKEVATPIYANFYDHPESRTGVFEFDNTTQLEEVAKAFTDKEINGSRLSVEIYELKGRQNRRVQKRGHHGGQRAQRGGQRGGRRGGQRGSVEKPSADQLDQELDAYMRN